MAGVIERWDSRKISHQGWIRLAIRPQCRASGRTMMEKYKIWFITHGRGSSMFWVVDHSRYFTIAFSDITDCVLFSLTFPEAPVTRVPQPYAHEFYDVG